jgi:hypothetical protein
MKSRGEIQIKLHSFRIKTGMRSVVSPTPQCLCPREISPTFIKKKAVCAPEQELTLQLGIEIGLFEHLNKSSS